MTEEADLELVDAAGAMVYRVGRAPDPWAWIDHQYGGAARWDDPDVAFRTTYAADSPFGCFVESLAYARPDRNADGTDLLSGIDEDAADAADFPVPPAGSVPREWVTGRMIGTAVLRGTFVNVRASATVAVLRPAYLDFALSLGFDDFDAAALKRAHPRALTQRLTVDLYQHSDGAGRPTYDGVYFGSRHGDDLALWAIFERPGDEPSSRLLSETRVELVDPDGEDLVRAMRLHGLSFR